MNPINKSYLVFDNQQLTEARIQLHYAIQPLASVSNALADISHKGISWDDRLGFTTQIMINAKSYHVTLDPITFTLKLLSHRYQVISAFALSEHTFSEAFYWIRALVEGLGGEKESITPISYPPNDFPYSELSRGSAFNLNRLTATLAEQYANANLILQELVQQESMASKVRIWPHHFDIATLIAIPDDMTMKSKSIGVGLSSGDSSYEQPYWYVTPYPYPDDISNLPDLDGNGNWHSKNWVGAVLMSSLFGNPNVSNQQVKAFLNSAIAACKTLLT